MAAQKPSFVHSFNCIFISSERIELDGRGRGEQQLVLLGTHTDVHSAPLYDVCMP